jgi:hypothetical protein
VAVAHAGECLPPCGETFPECNGECGPGEDCVPGCLGEICPVGGDVCICAGPPPPPCGDTSPVCDGTCPWEPPWGQECAPSTVDGGCECISVGPDPRPCGETLPICNGQCPSGEVCTHRPCPPPNGLPGPICKIGDDVCVCEATPP